MVKKNLTNYIKVILIVCLGLLIVSVILLSSAPPIAKDELVHHLAVPKLYIEHGGIYEIPFMEYSYYPMNLDLLYMIPLYFSNDIIPKFIHFTFALLTAWLIYCYLKSRTSKIYALFGSLFFLSIPIIVKLSITAYIDLGEIFFSFAALIMILEWMKSNFTLKYLIWASVLCGLALGTKYNGLVTLAILAFFVPFIYSRYQDQKAPGFVRPAFNGIVFIIISLIVFSPWMIKNYYWKNNPVYPLYDQVFNPPEEAKNGVSAQGDTAKTNQSFLTYRSLAYKETGWQIAMLPVRVFFQGKDGQPQYFDGRLNPFLLILPLFSFYRLKDEPEYLKREKKILFFFSAFFFLFAFFLTVLRTRYFSPIIPPLVILSVFGLINLLRIIEKISSLILRRAYITFVIFIPCFALALNADYFITQYKYINPIPFIMGKISRDEYIEKYIPEYPALRYINDKLDDKAKVLFIYIGKRGYYCDKEYLVDNEMETLKRPISTAERPEGIIVELRNQGITHLLINYRLFNKWVNDNFTEEKQILLQKFFREDLNLLYIKNGYGVLTLR
jgi:hypothetical protein